jgi:type I restriction enzyme S subunit
MDVQSFLEGFRQIASAPGGVAQLKDLILQLAISGRLVKRAMPETPVASLIEGAAKLRERYAEELGLKSERIGGPTKPGPFEIPEHWQWVELDRLCLYIQRGKSPVYADKGTIRVVSQKCIQWRGFDPGQLRFISDTSAHGYGKERYLQAGDLLWNSTGAGTAGRAAIYDGAADRAVVDSHVTVVRLANVVPRFLWCLIAAPSTQARIHASHPKTLVSGSTQQVELTAKSVKSLLIPCPPKEEQIRIVEKVDELLSLCDRLDSQYSLRDKIQSSATESTIGALANARMSGEIEQAWIRVQSNMRNILNEPEDVNQLRDSIAYLTMYGLAGGKSTSIDCRENSEPSSLPVGWEWQTLDSLTEYVTSGSRGWNAYLSTAGDRFIRTQDIKTNVLSLSAPAFVALPDNAEGKRTLVRQNDLLLTITGGNVGRCALVPELPYKAYVSQHIALARLHDPELAELVHAWMTNIFGGQKALAAHIYGDKPGLNLGQVRRVLVPVPPPNLRLRVLQTLRRNRDTCEDLANQIRAVRSVAAALAPAAVAALTGVAHNQEDELVRPPQTELIALLRLGKTPTVKDQAPLAALLARHQGEMSARDLWQRFGGEIDAFYAQLKAEVVNEWIAEPAQAEMREVLPAREDA